MLSIGMTFAAVALSATVSAADPVSNSFTATGGASLSCRNVCWF
jgi:hypothetical protein